MTKPEKPQRFASACPHDCPSTCAVEVEVYADGRIGRLHGARDNDYTAGVICAKVARYAERLHHPDRLTKPLRRTGPKGSGQFEEISWEDALAEVTDKFLAAEQKHGPQTVWPYFFAGTMGLVQRDSIDRLRNAKGYSGMYQTFCTNMAWTGYIAGTGKLAGPDPREMALADAVVIWGTNPVATQINVMTLAIKARKANKAKIVVVDVYKTETMKQADICLVIKPGSDAALACALMHVFFRDGYADRAYMEKYADAPAELEEHLKTRSPEWASKITGLSVDQIEEFAKLVGETKKTFYRLGYGFTRQRNGVVSMHAASCVGVVGGNYQYKGGGVFHNNGAIYGLNMAMVEAHSLRDTSIRKLDMSQVGRVLTGDKEALMDGPPITAMLIQNTNPVSVAPEQTLVKQGFAREDLFLVVHEQFMTETAKMADIVLPATQFLEHDDIYKGAGHQNLLFGPKLTDAPGDAKENLYLLNQLIARLGGTEHEGHAFTAREHIDWMLKNSKYPGGLAELEEKRWLDCQPEFDEAHYINGFGYEDGKFRFKPDWPNIPAPNNGPMGPWQDMPVLPDHWDINEMPTADCPFRLVTSPSRSFLNSTFTETLSSQKKEGRPTAMLHTQDAAQLGLQEGDKIVLSNPRGQVHLFATIGERPQKGTIVAEGIWPNAAHEGGNGINTLTGADQIAPFGGAAFHDIHVAIHKA